MPSDRDVMSTKELLKSYLRSLGIEYTGRQTDANKLLHIGPIFKGFVMAHLEHYKSEHGYSPAKDVDGFKPPGVKAHIFAPFRDTLLPEALKELRKELWARGELDDGPTVYLYKRNQNLKCKGVDTGRPCIQGVVGWEYKKATRSDENEAVRALVTLGATDERQDAAEHEAAEHEAAQAAATRRAKAADAAEARAAEAAVAALVAKAAARAVQAVLAAHARPKRAPTIKKAHKTKLHTTPSIEMDATGVTG